MTQRTQGSRGGPARGGSPFVPPTEAEIKQVIADGDPELLVKIADRVGQELAYQRLTTSQIRNVFGTARQIQMRWPTDESRAYREAVLLRPKLAYFAEREKHGMETLQQVLEPALKLISEDGKPSQKRYGHFVDLFEAIVAYHKRHGGK
jgi:CRISPR-associated protein Csm2